VPNVAENFEIESDGRDFVFTLRENMKWSDGEPFTAEDIMFWWNDVTLNEEISPAIPTWLIVGDQPPEVTSPDERTVVFSFAEPAGLFLFTMATFEGMTMLNAPKHYLTEFHIDYNSDAEEQARDAGYDTWSDWFSHHYSLWEGGIERKPTLDAWEVTVPHSGNVTHVEVERNPYYWKVDSEGSQLPYLDRVRFTVTESEEVRSLQALDGTFHLYLGGGDSQGANLQEKPLFAQGREESGYDFIDLIPANMNRAIFAVNLTCKDEAKRSVFLDKNFRMGLSHAINRDEVIDAIWVQQGEPWQAAPRPESRLHDVVKGQPCTDGLKTRFFMSLSP
jgi:peptide/nickel transport system substrate-binding protein